MERLSLFKPQPQGRDANQFVATAARLLQTHYRNRACLRTIGANPEELQKLSAHISNCEEMFKTAVYRYLRTL